MTQGPKWIRFVFRLFLGKKFFENIEGDVNELYTINREDKGRHYANRMYFFDFLTLMRLHTTKINYSIPMKGILSNHFASAHRMFFKRKHYFIINVTGLVLAITSSMFIFLYVQFENSFDKHHVQADKLYRLVLNTSVSTPGPMAGYLTEKIPGLEQFTRHNTPFQALKLKHDNEVFHVSDLAFVDPDFLDMFTLELNTTPDQQFLSDDQIGLSAEAANKHFATENPIGKRITINDSLSVQVAFVFEDLPANTHLQFNYLLPFEFQRRMKRPIDSWGRSSYGTYFRIKEGLEPDAIVNKINATLTELYAGHSKAPVASLQPVPEIHTTIGYSGDFAENIDPTYLRLLQGAAILILLLSTVNFGNLSLAMVSKRSKEAAVRRTIGASTGTLLMQLLTEIVLMAFFSLALSLFLIHVFTPFFNDFFGRSFGLIYINLPFILTLGVGYMVLFVVVGLYPSRKYAAYSFQSLKKQNAKLFNRSFRKLLIGFQFVVSITLLIVALVSHNQINYMMGFNTGVDRENVIVLPLYGSVHSELQLIKERLLANHQFTDVTATGSLPIDNLTSTSVSSLKWEGKSIEDDFKIHINWVASDYPKMLGLEFIHGTSFSDTKSGNEYIINREAWRRFQLENPGATQFTLWGSEGKLVGIVEDFHFQSFHHEVEPMVMVKESEYYEYSLIRYSGDPRSALELIERAVREVDQDYVSNVFFLDARFEEMYQAEKRFSGLFTFFSTAALAISAVGLFGFIAFIAERRMKEFSIRKVFGADTLTLFRLVATEFIVSLLVACIIAWPVAFYFADAWLSSFSYRKDIGLSIFIIPTIAVVLVTLLTITVQAAKLILTNPVQTLKDE